MYITAKLQNLFTTEIHGLIPFNWCSARHFSVFGNSMVANNAVDCVFSYNNSTTTQAFIHSYHTVDIQRVLLATFSKFCRSIHSLKPFEWFSESHIATKSSDKLNNTKIQWLTPFNWRSISHFCVVGAKTQFGSSSETHTIQLVFTESLLSNINNKFQKLFNPSHHFIGVHAVITSDQQTSVGRYSFPYVI